MSNLSDSFHIIYKQFAKMANLCQFKMDKLYPF